MNKLFLVENKLTKLFLSKNEIKNIQNLNYYLNSNKSNFNSLNYLVNNNPDENMVGETTSLFIKNIGQQDGNPFIELKTQNKVGVIHSGVQSIEVHPKIKESHFMYIIDKSLQIKLRFKNEKVLFSYTENNYLLLNYFIKIYLNSINAYINSWGIHKNYEKVKQKSAFLKGNINYVNTYLDTIRGKSTFDVTIDELTENTAINRVIKQAIIKIRKVEFFQSDNIRFFTTKILQIFSNVDDKIRHTDFTEAQNYSISSNNLLLKNIIEFSLIILKHTYFQPLQSGNSPSFSFLIDSPILIEDGLREIIKHSFKQKSSHVSKTSEIINILINNSVDENFTKKVTPDILIKHKKKQYVIDIKYKIMDITKNNLVYESDLYQIVTYLDVFKAEIGILVAFSETSNDDIFSVNIANKKIFLIFWSTEENDPNKSKKKLIEQIHKILNNLDELL